MTVNREREVGITRDGKKTEAVTYALLDINNSQCGVVSAGVPSFTIDQSAIRPFDALDIDGNGMIPG